MSGVLAGISDARLYSACVVVLLYLTTCAYFLWPRRGPAIVSSGGDRAGAPTLIAFASQTGFAADLANRTAQSLQAAGAPVLLASLQNIDEQILRQVNSALFVVSTTGEGDAPDPAAGFVRNILDRSIPLKEMSYGVLALGDREYDNYCAFGHRLDQWLRHQGATALFDVIEVDNGDEGALRHWQHQLSVLSNSPDLPDWEAPRYERWRLTARRHVNPGSAGDACFHIELQPPAGASARWQAGDIAEIDPRNSTWDAKPEPLPHREYSIASLPADGAIHLLVRQMRRPDGEPGLGSGWLTAGAKVGDDIAVRVRSNPNFHAPESNVPLILIGNGTGIAGLRSLIKARIARGRHRNWLIFGERSVAHDCFYGDELDRWRAQGQVERIDLVFSRDQPERRYVQHRVRECADDLRRWVDEGAAIYVCGSLLGMAPAVDAALSEVLGVDTLEQLAIAGRYRRDVY
ncbi:flavodoxin domain-containing protein [Steroidobacter sp. S1-65]|uniref:NADPH--hemoprotein reductase n=1 Tax=Steroidobacter gossypii TaxID=2805490 RepID=A0ABS1X4Z8_9GAMM|nr:sulfite reductase subunit alpha [Steroidobacter gossypii]MBM0108289.1 flavodoxin domain-containing protein [Steroidobacter gossypii]